jgi:GT2 family glycosyltransferase
MRRGTTMSDVPEISVVIVNYNGREHLEACLSAVAAQRGAEFECVLVDNGSTDGSASFVAERFPWVRLVRSETNLGFAGGNNRGATVARGRLIAFLNNDTRASATWLFELRRGLDEEPDVALVTSRIVYMGNPAVLDSAGDGMTRAGGAFKHGHGGPAGRHPDRREVFGACGAAFMMRRSVFDELGGFDEDFFLSHEDVDLSYRARLLGHRILYLPDAVVEHRGSTTIGRTSRLSVFQGQRNLEWVYVKNTPGPFLWRTLVPHLVYDLAALVYFATSGHLSTFLSAKWAAARGLGRMRSKRREIQRTRRVDLTQLWALLEPGWLGLKWREKRFDLELTKEP